MKLSLKLIIAVTLCVSNLSVGWAQRQYPGSPGLPDDVVWMREIYRTLDLTKDTNGALYYPVEPQGNKMNLFTTMFRLLALIFFSHQCADKLILETINLSVH